jgi:hypothetical protein
LWKNFFFNVFIIVKGENLQCPGAFHCAPHFKSGVQDLCAAAFLMRADGQRRSGSTFFQKRSRPACAVPVADTPHKPDPA